MKSSIDFDAIRARNPLLEYCEKAAPPKKKRWSHRQSKTTFQNLTSRNDSTSPTESKRDNALCRALSREESRSELITRLAREFAPVAVRDLVAQHPGVGPQQLVLMVTQAWRRFQKEAGCQRQILREA